MNIWQLRNEQKITDLFFSSHLTSNLPELLCALREGDDLGGAHEGEVQGVEEQHHVLAGVVGKAHVLKEKFVEKGTNVSRDVKK